MTGDPGAVPRETASRNFAMRIVAAIVLAPLALALAYAGGWLWALFATLVALGLFAEWAAIVGTSRVLGSLLGGLWLVIAGANAALGEWNWALGGCALGALGAGLLARAQRGWIAGGVVYAAVAMLAAILLRRDASEGFSAIIFVLLLVWATDSGGYFAGRAIGGPRLAPRISPNKTWAGALGGFVGALLVAAAFAWAEQGRLMPLLTVAAALSVASQAGDLFESAVKRRFGVKDSGRLIPGHGGLLDRLDGLVAAILVAAVIGTLRGGSDGAGRGLMVW